MYAPHHCWPCDPQEFCDLADGEPLVDVIRTAINSLVPARWSEGSGLALPGAKSGEMLHLASAERAFSDVSVRP